MEGGCLCGSVRYRVDGDPLAVVACHCRNCQRQSGSALSIVVVIPRAALHVEGQLKTFQDRGTSGQPVFRQFCPSCGSPILTDTPAAEGQGLIFIKGGSLDAAQDLVPTTHYWTERAHGWIAFPDGCEILKREEAVAAD
jgi:hypothetical protein